MLFPCQKLLKNRNCLNFLMFLQGVVEQFADEEWNNRGLLPWTGVSENYYLNLDSPAKIDLLLILNIPVLVRGKISYDHQHVWWKKVPAVQVSCFPAFTYVVLKASWLTTSSSYEWWGDQPTMDGGGVINQLWVGVISQQWGYRHAEMGIGVSIFPKYNCVVLFLSHLH